MAKKTLKKKTLKKKTTAKATPKLSQITDPVLGSAKDVWRAGLGALAMAQKESGKVVEQGSALFEHLVSEGAKLEKEGRSAADSSAARVRESAAGVRDEVEGKLKSARRQVEDRWDKLESVFEDRVARAMSGLGVPTADDLNKLSARVESLSRQVAELSASRAKAQKQAAKKPAKAAKPATKAAKKPAEADGGAAVYHLVPRDEGWAVRAEGGDKDLSVHGTKREGLDAARGVAQAHEPSRLVVHKSDGTIQTSYSYGED